MNLRCVREATLEIILVYDSETDTAASVGDEPSWFRNEMKLTPFQGVKVLI